MTKPIKACKYSLHRLVADIPVAGEDSVHLTNISNFQTPFQSSNKLLLLLSESKNKWFGYRKKTRPPSFISALQNYMYT